ncbi:MAG: Arsenite efflux ATP-binding protein ArsA [Frankiales bacterium]|nr:Arsenite efflux ATP-binding protein ArsA [Frankiales bacterium]
MRIILFTGKGGVGKSTTAAATAIRLADRGVKTLIVSTDGAHSLGDAFGRPLGDEPTELLPGLAGAELQTQHRFEAAWQDVHRYLTSLLSQDTDPITADELTVLPGIDEVLSLLAVRELAGNGRWDALVVDCAPTAETLRLLALPEALNWYLQRVLPMQRALARGLRPMAALFGRAPAGPDTAVFDAVLRLSEGLAAVRAMLSDPQLTSIRLVTTPERMVVAETRRTFTALALYGYPVDGVVTNRIIPRDESMSAWQQGWLASQADQLAELRDSFAGLPIRHVSYRTAEPVGAVGLREVADELYGPLAGPRGHPERQSVNAGPDVDPLLGAGVEPLLSVRPVDSADGRPEFELSLRLPLLPGPSTAPASPADESITASRSGDELVLTVAGHRRLLTLPSVLRRCVVTSGSVREDRLLLHFQADPQYWPGRQSGRDLTERGTR